VLVHLGLEIAVALRYADFRAWERIGNRLVELVFRADFLNRDDRRSEIGAIRR
jgi:hypothetical protein